MILNHIFWWDFSPGSIENLISITPSSTLTQYLLESHLYVNEIFKNVSYIVPPCTKKKKKL